MSKNIQDAYEAYELDCAFDELFTETAWSADEVTGEFLRAGVAMSEVDSVFEAPTETEMDWSMV